MTLTALQAAAATMTTLSVLSKVGALDQLRRGRADAVPVCTCTCHASSTTSPVREALNIASYTSWTVYGALALDWVVVGNQLLGVAVCAALLIQAITRSRPPVPTTQKG